MSNLRNKNPLPKPIGTLVKALITISNAQSQLGALTADQRLANVVTIAEKALIQIPGKDYEELRKYLAQQLLEEKKNPTKSKVPSYFRKGAKSALCKICENAVYELIHTQFGQESYRSCGGGGCVPF